MSFNYVANLSISQCLKMGRFLLSKAKELYPLGAVNTRDSLHEPQRYAKALYKSYRYRKIEESILARLDSPTMAGYFPAKEYIAWSYCLNWHTQFSEKHGFGNCGPQASSLFKTAIDMKLGPVRLMSSTATDHAYIVIGQMHSSIPYRMAKPSLDAVIVDPHLDETYLMGNFSKSRFYQEYLFKKNKTLHDEIVCEYLGERFFDERPFQTLFGRARDRNYMGSLKHARDKILFSSNAQLVERTVNGVAKHSLEQFNNGHKKNIDYKTTLNILHQCSLVLKELLERGEISLGYSFIIEYIDHGFFNEIIKKSKFSSSPDELLYQLMSVSMAQKTVLPIANRTYNKPILENFNAYLIALVDAELNRLENENTTNTNRSGIIYSFEKPKSSKLNQC